MKSKKVVSIRVSKPGSSPDVDSDFNTKVREKTVKHVIDIYGEESISNIVTFQKLAAKGAFKALCTVNEIPFKKANEISNLIPKGIEGVEPTLSDIFDPMSDFYDTGEDFRNAVSNEEWAPIIELASSLEGRSKSTGIHACGIIMSSQPLKDVIPLQVRQNDGTKITQTSYAECENLGLLKMDFLGLDTVDLIQHTVEYIMKSGQTPPNMVELIRGPMDDKKTFEMIQKGHTTGVFQLASPGVKDLLKKMQPTSIDDIAATTALYRPGPMGLQSHVKYAERKSGRDTDTVPVHPDFVGSPLEKILGTTQNICIYQEQVLQISNQIAGMTLQEGDDLRKAMGKKKVAVMNQMKPLFINGALDKGYSLEAVEALWNTIAEFSKYGFNKAHSYSYAIVAYQSAYLKANYPVEFMSALISQNIQDKKKILEFLKECKRMGISVGTVDVNVSQADVSPDFNNESEYDIVFGFSGAMSVSQEIAEKIVEERNNNGNFKNFDDFVQRCSKVGVDRKSVFQMLAAAGAFDSFGIGRKYAMERTEGLLKESKKSNTLGDSLFDMMDEDEEENVDYGDINDEYSFDKKLKLEADVIGLYLTDHPLSRIGKAPAELRNSTISKLIKENRRATVRIAASITNLDKKTSRKGAKSIIANIDDTTGYLEARFSKELIKAFDKMDNQKMVKSSYIAGANVIKDEIKKSVKDKQIKALPKPEVNNIYCFDINFKPSYDGGAPTAYITNMLPITLTRSGRLPVRIRTRKTSDPKMKKVYDKLPGALSRKIHGDYPISIANIDIDNIEECSYLTVDQIYEDAIEDMVANPTKGIVVDEKDTKTRSESSLISSSDAPSNVSKKTKAKKSDIRSWPPARYGTDRSYSIFSKEPGFNEFLIYEETPYLTDKSTEVELGIEKYIGAENYDFGIFDNDLLKDERS